MKTNQSLFLTFFLFSFTLVSHAQVETLFNEVKMGESIDMVSSKLESISEATELISIDTPNFPLAQINESHLICAKVKTKNGSLDRMVFTFADDKLCYIEAKGNVYEVLNSKRKDTARTYMDYDVYFKDRLFLKSSTDQAWILNQESAHVNLFTWENPHLKNNDVSSTSFSGKLPEFIKMGASIDELKPGLEANSKFTNTEELDGSDPNAQLQINCFGVNYAGFPRKFELRFGDNKLNVVWILTAKGEEDRIRQEIVKHYGKPIFTNEAWEIYHDWQIGLRLDKPEVLLMTKEIGQFYKKEYFKQ